MNYESFGAFAGAELAPTPVPHDPTGKLEAEFEATHAGYLDSTGDVDTFPYGDEPEVEVPAEPEVEVPEVTDPEPEAPAEEEDPVTE